ncbi:MAG: c-type cytochrome biogenesis protein CcmI [Gammaproteobacteria bacterium]|nr:c-type cytochrome biogenesis protein CcmI [Gammaproteobacteria bacterium]
MIFIILTVLMILLAAASVTLPLWRAQRRPWLSTGVANRAVHAARVEELERDLAAGRLAQEDHAAARRDLDQELQASLAEDRTAQQRAAQARGSRVTAAVTALLMITAVVLLYWQLGSWRTAVEGVRSASIPKVEEMVAQLAQRLASTDQDDLQGWIMLGRSYVVMGRYSDAEGAFARARQLTHDQNAEALAGYAESMTLQDPGMLMTKAAPLFEQVLKLQPGNAEGLWYGGLIAYARGDKSLAVQRWQALLTQNPPENFRALIIAHIQAAGGVVPAATGAAGAGVTVQVTLDPALRSTVSPDEALFVFAEPAGQGGGPPLAVRRFQVRDLPLNVMLSDQDAMVAGRKLSDFRSVNLVARISRHGTPLPQPGDLMGEARWRAGEKSTVTIRISRVVP